HLFRRRWKRLLGKSYPRISSIKDNKSGLQRNIPKDVDARRITRLKTTETHARPLSSCLSFESFKPLPVPPLVETLSRTSWDGGKVDKGARDGDGCFADAEGEV